MSKVGNWESGKVDLGKDTPSSRLRQPARFPTIGDQVGYDWVGLNLGGAH